MVNARSMIAPIVRVPHVPERGKHLDAMRKASFQQTRSSIMLCSPAYRTKGRMREQLSGVPTRARAAHAHGQWCRPRQGARRRAPMSEKGGSQEGGGWTSSGRRSRKAAARADRSLPLNTYSVG